MLKIYDPIYFVISKKEGWKYVQEKKKKDKINFRLMEEVHLT